MFHHVFRPSRTSGDHSAELQSALWDAYGKTLLDASGNPLLDASGNKMEQPGSTLFVPDGDYFISGVEVPHRVHLLCESPRTTFRHFAGGPSDAMLKVTKQDDLVPKQPRRRVRITGGTWCESPVVFRQDTDSGSVSASIFEHMRIGPDVRVGFNFHASQDNKFQHLVFEHVGQRGNGGAIVFTGGRCSMHNVISESTFKAMNAPAIVAGLRKVITRTGHLQISACRFETAHRNTAAIVVKGPARSVHVERCEFRRALDDTADIVLDGGSKHTSANFSTYTGPIEVVTVEMCCFVAPAERSHVLPGKKGRRIHVMGDVGVDIRHNHVTLPKWAESFITVAPGRSFGQPQAIVLNRNCVSFESGSYVNRLVRRETGSGQQVRIVTWPGLGATSDREIRDLDFP